MMLVMLMMMMMNDDAYDGGDYVGDDGVSERALCESGG
jgi:hypothetical protein